MQRLVSRAQKQAWTKGARQVLMMHGLCLVGVMRPTQMQRADHSQPTASSASLCKFCVTKAALRVELMITKFQPQGKVC